MHVSIQQQTQSSKSLFAGAADIYRFLAVAAQNNRLGLALQTEAPAATESLHQLKDNLHAMIASISLPAPSENEEGGAEKAFLSEMIVGFLNEFHLNCVILDITDLYQNMSAPCA